MYINDLFDAHKHYREPALQQRRFKHAAIQPLIKRLPDDMFKVEQVGASVEGKGISLIRWGRGQVRIMLWSQMHGDEATATMAFFDLFNFLSGTVSNTETLTNEMAASHRRWRENLAAQCTLYFIPMLNPDGADAWTRRNALHIDLNRDAVALQSPEAVLLKQLHNRINPHWGFNLHDQRIYYSAGNSPVPATISLLAPPYNLARSVNETRLAAMQLCGHIAQQLQAIIPNGVGKFSDEFEPRAFGDNIQKWGTRTVLIEAGGYPADREKQHIRRIYFAALSDALRVIAEQAYMQIPPQVYDDIPLNEVRLKDLVLRNLTLTQNYTATVDVAFVHEEITQRDGTNFLVKGCIDDIGDLSGFYGYEEIDCSTYTLRLINGAMCVGDNPELELLDEAGVVALRIKNGCIVFQAVTI